MYYVTTCYVPYVNIMPCSMLYLCDVICSWNIIMFKHSMFIKNSKVKIINEGMLSWKDFLCYLKNKTDKSFKKLCLFMSRGLSGQGVQGTSVPTTDDWPYLERFSYLFWLMGKKRPFFGWLMCVWRHGLVILA